MRPVAEALCAASRCGAMSCGRRMALEQRGYASTSDALLLAGSGRLALALLVAGWVVAGIAGIRGGGGGGALWWRSALR